MDINTIRGLATLFALVAFVSMVIWAYSSKRRKDFDEAASLPFADDDQPPGNQAGMKSSQQEESKNHE